MEKKEFHPFCEKWHAQGQCWSEGQCYGCSSFKGNHPSDECRQLNKIISVPYPVVIPQQQAKDNMKGARSQSGPPNEVRPPNLYYNHGNARSSFHPPTELQTANGYIPIQGGQGDSQNFNNKHQAPPTDPSRFNSQDVRFIDGIVESHYDDILPFQMGIGEELCQWPSYNNVIIFD